MTAREVVQTFKMLLLFYGTTTYFCHDLKWPFNKSWCTYKISISKFFYQIFFNALFNSGKSLDMGKMHYRLCNDQSAFFGCFGKHDFILFFPTAKLKLD